MDEIEVKVIGEDTKSIRKKLIQIGAHKSFDGKITTYYFDTPTKRFKKEKKVLRMRKRDSDEFWILGFKSTIEDDGISRYDEHELRVEDGEVMIEILKKSGFIVSNCIEKSRVVYDFPTAEIVFDKLLGKYNKVPEYFEIEADSKAILRSYIKELGIKKENVKSWNSHQLIEFYLKKK